MEGLYHRGALRPPLLVLPPVPHEGGGMDHVVAAELAFASASSGHQSLRFNYRGVGASQGQRSSGTALYDDALAALELCEENAQGAQVFVASIGSSDAVAVALCEKVPTRVCGLAFINPSITPTSLAAVTHPWHAIVPQAELTEAWRNAAQVSVVPGADKSFQRHLPLVGKLVVECMARHVTG